MEGGVWGGSSNKSHRNLAAQSAYLGIDHMNKTRGMRGGHTTEKAIVIHN